MEKIAGKYYKYVPDDRKGLITIEDIVSAGHEGLLEASNFIETIQKRQGLYIACLEEIAYLKGYIDDEELLKTAKELEKTDYWQYLFNLVRK